MLLEDFQDRIRSQETLVTASHEYEIAGLLRESCCHRVALFSIIQVCFRPSIYDFLEMEMSTLAIRTADREVQSDHGRYDSP